MLIGKRYQIGEQLGEGSMGEVFHGLDTLTQTKVAIKRLKLTAAQPEMIERFRREGIALRQLNHPNIVKLLDTVEDDVTHYLVMELVTGGDLKSLLKQTRMRVDQVIALALDLADALTRAHKLDILHRDLKPANVLLAEDGTLRLTDFGVARIGDSRLTAANRIVGTIDYIAPETLGSGTVDARADIWAFGVMLFEMLGGRRPFTGETITDTLINIKSARPPDLQALCPDAPDALVDLVYRMLERDPENRVPSVRIVGAELEAIQRRNAHNGLAALHSSSERFATTLIDILPLHRHNLPAQSTAFIGRENELLDLARLLDDPSMRLVTILAPGGMGKTRLSLEAAGRMLERFNNGVYFVELAPLGSIEALLPAIANAVGYRFQADERPQLQQLLDFFSNKQMLLVLDNFEHLLDGAEIVTRILEAAPHLRIVVTSRRRLQQPGEALYHLGGMDFPEWETPQDALEYAAVKLFLSSARRAQPAFDLQPQHLNHVARICRHVEGMPLGIVLAASWLTMLSVEEIAQEIERSLDFLEAQEDELPARQRSIRAIFDYSWEMLNEEEQRVFAALSIFRGGFTREAADAVTGATLHLLMGLVQKSLLRRNPANGRYAFHELLRQYAEQHLNQSGQRESYLHRSAEYFLKMISELYRDGGLQNPDAIKLIMADAENVQIALRHAVQMRPLWLPISVIYVLEDYFDLRGIQQRGVSLLLELLNTLREQHRDLPASLLAEILITVAWLEYGYDSHRAIAHCEQVLAIIDQLDPETQARAYAVQAAILFANRASVAELEPIVQHLTAIPLPPNALYLLARQQMTQAYLCRVKEDYQGALQMIQTAVQTLQQIPDHPKLYYAYLFQAITMADLGEFDRSLAFYERTLREAQRWDALFVMSEALGGMAGIYSQRGDHARTRACIYDSIVAHLRIGQRWQTAGILMGVSRAYPAYIGGVERAVEVLAMVAHQPETATFTRENVQRALQRHRAELGDERTNQAWERGKTLSFETTVQQVLAILRGS